MNIEHNCLQFNYARECEFQELTKYQKVELCMLSSEKWNYYRPWSNITTLVPTADSNRNKVAHK